MARLQILELPEGSGDDRPPFVLVVDQVPRDEPAFEALRRDLADNDIAARIGAQGALCFETTIDIPANDVQEQINHSIQAATADLVNELNRDPARERTDIARDMDRLANHKTALLDALGMDRTRDWDDIRNAAAGMRKDRDAQAAELERLHAGEEPATDNRVAPTPAQWIWQWNRATPEKRLSMAAQILDGMTRANDCLMADHEAQIANLRAQHGATEKPDA